VYCRLILLAVFLGQNLCAPAATFHVAQGHPRASDDGLGSEERPWKSISRAITQAKAGDSVIIQSGIYRERILVENSGTAEAPLRFEAAPGAHVVVTGADRITDWQRLAGERAIYSVPWPHRFVTWSPQMTHPSDEYHRLIGRCEQVIVDGYLLRQVLEATQLAPGTFWVDVTNQVLQAWDMGNRDLNKVFAEASVRQEIFRVTGGHVQFRGMTFRYAANTAQHGALILGGAHGVLEDCVVEGMNASGATFTGTNLLVRRCIFRDNGQMGFGASGAHDLLFTDCRVENNNVKGFDRGWESGGDKLVLCRNAILKRSRFVRNRGTGIWFDIGNENCTVRQCLVADNEDSGIFYEISYGLRAYDNVIVANGFSATPGAWGAQAGISLSSSPDCVIERNLILGNREGFNFREQNRATARIGKSGEVAVWNHDQVIRNNMIVYNQDAQIWGWFDIADERNWPAKGKTNAVGNSSAAHPGDIAEAYAAKTDEGQPQGLTLETLRLRFSDNVYFAAPGQGWFAWGPTWRRHQRYNRLSDFEELGIDSGSRVEDPMFADLKARDYRLPKAAMSRLQNAYPKSAVPGVQLGVQP
jgi:hypothetical protein